MREVVATRSRLALPTTTTSKASATVSRSAGGSGANADRSDQAVAGGMAFVLGLAAPEAVLVVRPGELDAGGLHRATGTHLLGRRLAAFAGLRPFGRRREEQMREALAGALSHPVVIGLDAIDGNFDGRHV